MTRPRVGVSLGDPGGIGPEIILKSFLRPEILPPAEFVLFGSGSVLEAEARHLGMVPFWEDGRKNAGPTGASVRLIDCGPPPAPVARGGPSAENGRASFLYFEQAVAAACRGELEAVVTAPISKTSWSLAGVSFRGQTEYLAQFYPDAVMTFWSERLTVALLSHHLPLEEALLKVTRAGLSRLFRILAASFDRVRPGAYEFLVAGLNPHAGEGGLLGMVEKDEIAPAVEEARSAGLRIRGPLSPDIVFREALDRPERVVVALYHDQGLIPFKLLSFETGVNVTLGLPFVRTSPDHGTAFDIAGKNSADPRSLLAAVRLAVGLTAGVL